MATSLDYSRAVNLNIKAKAGRTFDAALSFSRDDSGTVNWTGKTLKFDVYNNFGTTAVVTWTNDDGIAVSTDTITFDQVFQSGSVDLDKGLYKYEFYNDTDKQGIAYGKVELI